MAALLSRCGHYIFALWFLLSSSSFLSSPNLCGRRLDVYHSSTHDGQLYVNCPVHSTENAISQLADCIRDVAAWIGAC